MISCAPLPRLLHYSSQDVAEPSRANSVTRTLRGSLRNG